MGRGCSNEVVSPALAPERSRPRGEAEPGQAGGGLPALRALQGVHPKREERQKGTEKKEAEREEREQPEVPEAATGARAEEERAQELVATAKVMEVDMVVRVGIAENETK